MYPYNLTQNPFPSSPTPSKKDSLVLGGSKHKEANNSIYACVNGLHSQVGINDYEQFRVITIIQDVGSGKTHLALHVKNSDQYSDKSIVSYIDLAQVNPKNISNIYNALIKGFHDNFFEQLKSNILNLISISANQQDNEYVNNVKKLLGFTFRDKLSGKKIDTKIEEIRSKKQNLDLTYLGNVLSKEFSNYETRIIKSIFENDLESVSQSNDYSIQNVIDVLSLFSKLNQKLFNKITIIQLDELDSNTESLSFVKAIINAHLPYTILNLMLTPSSYKEISTTDASVFDRLEKANYKIDLAGSNSYREIIEIIFEYINACGETNLNFGESSRTLLRDLLKILCIEFSDFRNIRSMINLVYHTFELAKMENKSIIDEEIIGKTIKNIYPNLRVKNSIMDISISDFAKIELQNKNYSKLEENIRTAIVNLNNKVNNNNLMDPNDWLISVKPLSDVNMEDYSCSKISLSVLVTNKIATKNKKSNEIHSTDTKSNNGRGSIVYIQENNNQEIESSSTASNLITLDGSKIIDLLYFNMINGKNPISACQLDDKISLLARAINLI